MSSPIPKPPAPPVASSPSFGGNAAMQQNYASVAGFKMPAGGLGAPTDLQPPSPTGVPGWDPNAGGPISRPGGAPDFVPMGDDVTQPQTGGGMPGMQGRVDALNGMQGGQDIGSPPSAFGMGMQRPMDKPMQAGGAMGGMMAGGNMAQSPGRQQLARLLMMRGRRGGVR